MSVLMAEIIYGACNFFLDVRNILDLMILLLQPTSWHRQTWIICSNSSKEKKRSISTGHSAVALTDCSFMPLCSQKDHMLIFEMLFSFWIGREGWSKREAKGCLKERRGGQMQGKNEGDDRILKDKLLAHFTFAHGWPRWSQWWESGIWSLCLHDMALLCVTAKQAEFCLTQLNSSQRSVLRKCIRIKRTWIW